MENGFLEFPSSKVAPVMMTNALIPSEISRPELFNKSLLLKFIVIGLILIPSWKEWIEESTKLKLNKRTGKHLTEFPLYHIWTLNGSSLEKLHWVPVGGVNNSSSFLKWDKSQAYSSVGWVSSLKIVGGNPPIEGVLYHDSWMTKLLL